MSKCVYNQASEWQWEQLHIQQQHYYCPCHPSSINIYQRAGILEEQPFISLRASCIPYIYNATDLSITTAEISILFLKISQGDFFGVCNLLMDSATNTGDEDEKNILFFYFYFWCKRCLFSTIHWPTFTLLCEGLFEQWLQQSSLDSTWLPLLRLPPQHPLPNDDDDDLCDSKSWITL